MSGVPGVLYTFYNYYLRPTVYLVYLPGMPYRQQVQYTVTIQSFKEQTTSQSCTNAPKTIERKPTQ